MATQTAAIAAHVASEGDEVLPIGGFTGSAPSPTLSQLQADIRAGKFRFVLGLAATTDPRMAWIAAHCQESPSRGGTIRAYFCLPGNAGGQGPGPIGASAPVG
jgi:hypothetical protein